MQRGFRVELYEMRSVGARDRDHRPPVLASIGRTAFRISVPGFALTSSEFQNATSVPITATAVGPRSRRKLARTSIEMPP
jgi:hypothetical protein